MDPNLQTEEAPLLPKEAASLASSVGLLVVKGGGAVRVRYGAGPHCYANRRMNMPPFS